MVPLFANCNHFVAWFLRLLLGMSQTHHLWYMLSFRRALVEKYKTFLEKAFNKRNEVMAEYDAAKAAQEEGGGGEEVRGVIC